MKESTADKLEGRMVVGLDLGDRYTQICVLDEAGEVIEEARVTTTPKALARHFQGTSPARLVLEVGTHSHWVSRLLADLGHEVIVANPRMLRFIFGNISKSDRADAAYLARVGRLDPGLLSPVVHRSEANQADLALVRSRDALVRSRANLVNHARGMVKVFGARLPMCSTTAFAKKAEELNRPAFAGGSIS